MRVLLLSLDSKGIGGIQTYLKNYEEGLLKINTNTIIEKVIINKKTINLFILFKIFLESLKSKSILVTHVSILNIFFLIFFKKKTIVFFYGIDIFSLRGLFVKLILKNIFFYKYITCSNFTKNFSIQKLGLPHQNIDVVYPYSRFEFENLPQNLTKSSSKKIRILSVCRLEGKITSGIWLMLNAIEKLNSQNIYFDIVGEGKDKLKISNFVRDKNLQNIFFHGFQEDLIPFYTQSNITTAITDNAGFGISVLDSIFFNIPCIISKSSASYEIFQKCDYPFTIKNENDLDGLVKLLNKLNEINLDYELYNEIYLKKFSYKKFISSINKL